MKNNSKLIIGLLLVLAVGLFAYYYSTKDKEPFKSADKSILGCYVAKLDKDIYVLNIQTEEKGNVSGILAFNNYQKDSSSGTFKGTFKDDILLGEYSFDSEGMHSDRQVIFKKSDNNFIQGFGPVKMVDGKETFENVPVTYDPKSTFVKSENCKENFTDKNEVFSFDYNPFFKKIEGDSQTLSNDWKLNSKEKGILLGSIIVPKSYMDKTNFSDARMTVGRSTDPMSIRNCIIPSLNETKKEIKTIGGYPFTKFTFNEAGAGNLYETTSYRGIADGDCYVVEYTIHSTNIGNYSPDQGIGEFDKAKIENDLEDIIKSFKFLISSD